MATLGLYLKTTQEEANCIRAKLNAVALELGFVAQRGPTAGNGNLAAMLVAIADGRLVIQEVTGENRGSLQRRCRDERESRKDPLWHQLE